MCTAATAARAALLLVSLATAASVNGALLPSTKLETPKYSIGTALRYLSKAIYKNTLLNQGSACNTEIDVNAPGNDVGPATNQGSVRKCQLHCRANNVKYFTWRQADGNCWCKRLIKKENESGHFSGEALCAIDSFAEEEIRSDLESSNKQDSEDCVKRLICELHGSSEPLAWDEMLIKNYIEPELDYTSPIIQFQLAANLGKRQVSQCESVYSRCRKFDSKELMNMLRQRGISLTIGGGDATEYECTVLFLFTKKEENNIIEKEEVEIAMEA